MKRIQARVLNIRVLTPTVIELSLARTNSGLFREFLPGQYATLSFPTNLKLRGERSFSIAGSTTDRSILRFGIKISGKYTSALRDVRPGDPAMVGGPYGEFTFNAQRDKSSVFIAGGIGVTPFLSMIRSAINIRLPNELVLFYSLRSLSDAAFREDLDALEMLNPNFHVYYAISDNKIPGSSPRFISGRITPGLMAEKLGDTFGGRSYFLCGPSPFMKAMTGNLQSFGIPIEAIRTEKFSVGSSAIIERGTLIPKIAFAAWGLVATVIFSIVLRMEKIKRTSAQTIISNSNSVPAVISNSNSQINGNYSTGSLNQNSPAATSNNSGNVSPVTQPSPQQQTSITPRTTVS
jgi:ferredoxin-NADP reductase